MTLIFGRYDPRRRQAARDREGGVLGRRRGANVDARSASTGRGSQDPPVAPSSDPTPAGQARRRSFPRAGRRLHPRLLHVYIATAPRANAAPSLVFTDEAARILDRVPCDRISPGPAARPAGRGAGRPWLTLRAVVYALWNGRRLGYRRIAVHTDDPAAIAQLNGERHVDPDVVGLYLEARALMHLYKSARVDVGELMAAGPLAECFTSASF